MNNEEGKSQTIGRTCNQKLKSGAQPAGHGMEDEFSPSHTGDYLPFHTKIFFRISLHTSIPKNFWTGSNATPNLNLYNVVSNALTKVRVTLSRCNNRHLICRLQFNSIYLGLGKKLSTVVKVWSHNKTEKKTQNASNYQHKKKTLQN